MSKYFDHEIWNCGPDHPDHFQGMGTTRKQFDYMVIGIGYNAKEAYEDAVEQVFSDDDKIFPSRPTGIRKTDRLTKPQMEAGMYWFVGLYFNL